MKGNKHMKTIIHIIYPAVKTVTRKLAALAALTLICATGLAPAGAGTPAAEPSITSITALRPHGR